MLYGNLIFIKKSGDDGSKFPVTKKDIKIGRSEDCLIRISNPQVASVHCQLIIENSGQATLRNLSNHTILNDKQIGLEDITLHHGDIFKIGERLARWEYLPASKYYTQVLSPTKRLVAVVIPQQRYSKNPETSASIKKTPLGKRKFMDKTTCDSSSAVKNIKSDDGNTFQKSKTDLSKLFTNCQSLKTTKLALPGAKVKKRKSLSELDGLKVLKKAEKKSRRSTFASFATTKSTAGRVSFKKSHQKSSKSIKNAVNTPLKDVVTSKFSENFSSASDCGVKTPQESLKESKFSEEIIKSKSKSTLKTPMKRFKKTPPKISPKSTKSNSNSKSPSPKKNTLKKPSKLVLSTPKQKSTRKFANVVYSESKLASITKKHSLFPRNTKGISSVSQKLDLNSWQNSNEGLLDKQKKSEDLKTIMPEVVFSNEMLQTPLRNFSNESFLIKKKQTSHKSLKKASLKKTPEKLIQTKRKSIIKRSSKSPKDVKILRKSLIKNTLGNQLQKQPTHTRNLRQVNLDISVQKMDLQDLSNSKKEKPLKSVFVECSPVKTAPAKNIGKINGKKTVTQSLVEKSPIPVKSPVKTSTIKESQKTGNAMRKSESFSKFKPTSTRGVRRKLSPSSSAERAAKKLKTSCPKKPDKNKKAALLVLGIASRNQLLSQYVKVLSKKAIKQSNATYKLKNARRLQSAAELRKKLQKKTYKTNSKKTSKKNETDETILPIKIPQTTVESPSKSNKVVEIQQNVSEVQTSMHSPEKKAVESLSKQSRKSESKSSFVINKSLSKTTPGSFDNSAENYLFNTNRRSSKRLSSKNDTGRPDFVELSPTALGLIPKNIEVFKTLKDIKRRSSSSVIPKTIQNTGIIKSASTTKIGSRKSVRFSSKNMSLNTEFGSPNVFEKTDFDFSPFNTSDLTMDIFVSPLPDESNGTEKNLNEPELKFIKEGISKSVTKNREEQQKMLQSPHNKKSPEKISSNQKVRRISKNTALSSEENSKMKSTGSRKYDGRKKDLDSVSSVCQLFATPETKTSLKYTFSELDDISRFLKTSNEKSKSFMNDLTDVRGKKLLQTPKPQKSPKNDLSDVRGVKKLLRTPKQQRSPKNDLSDVRGVKELLRTPKQQRSPKNDLSDVRGVKKLFRTPKQQRGPKNDLSDVRGVKKLLRTPKQQRSPKNDLSDVRGVKKLFRTPKQQRSPKNDLSDVRGVKKLFRTPKQQRGPKNDLSDVRGVKKLLRTPKQQRSPKNDLSDVRGVKKLLRTPKQQRSPKNDLSDVRGVKKLLRTPKQQRSPKNDLSDVRGVKKLLQTPRIQKSPENSLLDVSGMIQLFKSPDKEIFSKISKKSTTVLSKTSPSRESSNKSLEITKENELLIPKTEESSLKNKKNVKRKLNVSDFRAIRGRCRIHQTVKVFKNEVCDLTGLRELFSSHKPINDLNVDMTGVADLFNLPVFKSVLKQRVIKSRSKSESYSVKSRTVTTRSKKSLKAEDMEAKPVTRGRLRKSSEKDTKREPLTSKKLRTSGEFKTESKEKKAIKRKAAEKVKTKPKKSLVFVNEKASETESHTLKEVKPSKIRQKKTISSRKRKVQFEDIEMSPPKQRRKSTGTEKSSSLEKCKKAVSICKSKEDFKEEISVKGNNRSKKVIAKEKDKMQKASSKVQPKKAIKSGTKQIQKVQNKRSRSSSKINVTNGENKISPRRTRSAKSGTPARRVASRVQSEEVEKKIVRSTAEKERSTAVVKKSTRRK